MVSQHLDQVEQHIDHPYPKPSRFRRFDRDRHGKSPLQLSCLTLGHRTRIQLAAGAPALQSPTWRVPFPTPTGVAPPVRRTPRGPTKSPRSSRPPRGCRGANHEQPMREPRGPSQGSAEVSMRDAQGRESAPGPLKPHGGWEKARCRSATPRASARSRTGAPAARLRLALRFAPPVNLARRPYRAVGPPLRGGRRAASRPSAIGVSFRAVGPEGRIHAAASPPARSGDER